MRLRSILNGAARLQPAGASGVADAVLILSAESLAATVPPSSMICALPSLRSAEFGEAFARALSLAPAAVMLPLVEHGRDLQQLGTRLAVAEAEGGLPDGSTRILAYAAETPRGALVLPSLIDASRRLAGLLWNPLRLAAALGIEAPNSLLASVEAQVVLVAASCGVPAIYAAADDGFSLLRGRGFAGILLDDARQVAAANAAFS